MDRQRYLRETSEALRETEESKTEERRTRLAQVNASQREVGDRTLQRLVAVLEATGLKSKGDRWQCPSCRSQKRQVEFVLEMRVVGRHVELRCSKDCRPNTIRALLGAPPYFPNPGRRRTFGIFPFR